MDRSLLSSRCRHRTVLLDPVIGFYERPSHTDRFVIAAHPMLPAYRDKRGLVMAENSREWHEETIKVDGTNLRVIKGGTGNPLLILHDELGFPGWLGWNSALAKRRTV